MEYIGFFTSRVRFYHLEKKSNAKVHFDAFIWRKEQKKIVQHKQKNIYF